MECIDARYEYPISAFVMFINALFFSCYAIKVDVLPVERHHSMTCLAAVAELCVPLRYPAGRSLPSAASLVIGRHPVAILFRSTNAILTELLVPLVRYVKGSFLHNFQLKIQFEGFG